MDKTVLTFECPWIMNLKWAFARILNISPSTGHNIGYDAYNHMDSGILWQTIVNKHCSLLHPQMQVKTVLCTVEAICQQRPETLPNSLGSSCSSEIHCCTVETCTAVWEVNPRWFMEKWTLSSLSQKKEKDHPVRNSKALVSHSTGSY